MRILYFILPLAVMFCAFADKDPYSEKRDQVALESALNIIRILHPDNDYVFLDSVYDCPWELNSVSYHLDGHIKFNNDNFLTLFMYSDLGKSYYSEFVKKILPKYNNATGTKIKWEGKISWPYDKCIAIQLDSIQDNFNPYFDDEKIMNFFLEYDDAGVITDMNNYIYLLFK